MPSCLIVDDSRVVRKVARRILEDLKFTCMEAEDGQQACVACAKAMPDAVLLDWNMPVMGGFDFLLKLRQMSGGDAPKVVFCSVESADESIQNAMDAGANGYIIKPFDREIITAKFIGVGLV